MRTFYKSLIALAFVGLSAGANAQTWDISQTAADHVTATISGTSPNYTLTISGTGAMKDFSVANTPWFDIRINIKTLVINPGVTTIGNYAFNACSTLTGALTIPNGVTSIGDNAFYYCSGFTGDLTIPNSVTTIGNYAFNACSALTGALTIPNGVTSIGDNAFHACSGFTDALTIGNSVTTIGVSAFENCSGFSSDLTIPNGVTSIGDYAFSYCSGFTDALTIGSSVTSIGDYAFNACSGFTSIICKKAAPSVPALGISAFYGVPNAIPVYVVCGMQSYFESSNWADDFNNFQEVPPVVTVQSNDNTMGMAQVMQQPTSCDNLQAIISATASVFGCFSQWSDGNTDNPRTVEVTEDITYTAEFTALPIVTVLNNNDLYGSASVVLMNTCENNEAVIEATANDGYHFVKWDDENIDNPRTVGVTSDITFMAIFEHTDDTDNILANQLNIYPNPAKDVITIASSELQNANYTVFSISGQTLMHGKLQNETTAINVSVLPSGIYFLKAENRTGKFVKE